nr:S-layer homology domain-containing protein [uncultured Oscillibacter sp.]
MKKFLSLVLALIMTMSLVTISAGATEYRDLTDKDEIQYEEAVAVLNRIGVITGYEDGSFRPETELTRGAAAKIIVSLMIGPEAASALPNNASPYPDVPAGHTFAGVIGYCKTAGYISGYGDGTFKPANPLTGYAFAKMLLGAIGYKSNIEGFVDTGWTMNVARIGNVAGLFDRISFDGAKAVTRDEACQLALNTLKATMVDYGNANTVVSSSGEVLTVQGSKAVYVTSNNRDINANINRRVISATNNELTLEFGEEHFKDLRLEHDRYDPAYDVYGHPSNEWSYKKVTIGTFKLPADFTFTKQMAHLEDTVATKEKALGLRNYDTYSTDHRGGYVNWSSPSTGIESYSSPFADATQIHINGWNARVLNSAYKQTAVPAGENAKEGNWYTYDARDIDKDNKELAPSLSELCDLTDNGVTVEVYVCPVDADFITDVVVTRTQLMEVDRIASDFVELDVVSPDSKDPRKDGDLKEIAGYNDYALAEEVISVKDNNYDAYNVLKDLKSGDTVAIIPYTTDDGKTWEVGEAYVPETVSGALTNVDIYNTKSKPDGNAIAITVGGTTYPIAQWNKDMREITGVKIRATKKDVTLYLDKLGNALLAKDVGNSDNWIVVGDYYQATLSTGRVGWFVHGWTIKGDEVDLELGSIRGAAEKYAPGELVKYDVASGGNGEYELSKPNYNERVILKDGRVAPWSEPQGAKDGNKQTGEGIYNIAQAVKQNDATIAKYAIKSNNSLLPLEFYNSDKAVDPVASTASGTDKDGDPVVHFDYGAADKNHPVGTDAQTAAATDGTVFCGEILDGQSGYYGDHDEEGVWTYRTTPYDGVKFIFVGFDSTNGEVEVINVVDGVQNVNYDELKQINRWWKNVGTNNDDFVASPAEAYVDKNGKVKAVVIKSDSAEANLKDLMIITDNKGANTSTKGGAEAPTSGTYYTRQYVSGEDGFKEEKTGYFDKALLVGDVITGSLQSNGIIRAKNFHAKDYTNRNPDGFYVKGIEPLKTQENKDSDYAFYVGPTTGKGTIRYLGTGTEGYGTLTNADILTSQDVMGIDTPYNKEGLIKVDGTTQFIDLRDGRPGNIDELSDLFDDKLCDHSTVELKVLVNGNKSSDGFRHAYVIMILEAKPAADNAGEPVLKPTAKDEAGKTLPANYDSDKKVWTINALPGTKVTLTANVSNVVVEQNAKWTVDGTVTNGKVVDVFAPDNKGDKITATFTVTNYDKDRKDGVTTDGKMVVEIVANEPDSTNYTLTLAGALAAAGEATVYADGKLVTSATNVYEIAKGNVSDPAYKGVDVKVYLKNNLITTNKTLKIGNTAVTYTSGTPDVISFVMKEDLDLVLVAADTVPGDNDEVITITLNGGITAAYKADATSEAVPVVSGEPVKKGGTVTFTSTGTGNTVIDSASEAAGGTAGTDFWNASNPTTDTLTTSVTYYSANKITVTGGNVAVKGSVLAANDVNVTNAAATFVPVGYALTVSQTGNSFDGFVVSTDAAVKHGENVTSINMADNKDVYVYGAIQANIDTGVKAVYGSNVALANKDYVDAATPVTLSAEDSTNKVVVEDAAGNGYGNAVASNTAALTSGKEYKAYTKVTLNVEHNATISVGTVDELGTGTTVVVFTQSTTSGGDTVGFAPERTIKVSGATAQAKDVTCTSEDAVEGTKHTGTANTGDVPTLVVTVKEKVVTLGLSS